VSRARNIVLSLVVTLASALSVSCDTDASACGEGSGRLVPRTFVVARLSFAVAEEPGIIEGFDLDHRVSDLEDDVSCHQMDAVDPDGRPGVDNALAELFRVVHALVGNAIDGLIQMAVNDGTLLVVFRIEGLDDLENDDCVEVQMLKGTGPTVPQLATTGFLAPSQTFEVDEGTPITSGRGRIEDGVLYAGPFEAIVPLKFFQVLVDMRLHNAHLRAEITPQGGLTHGVLGGGIEVNQVLEVVEQAAENDGTAQTILVIAPRAIGGLADLEFDGDRCTQASAALVFEAEPAYLIGDSLEKNRSR
jgi:hypothetical protein